MKNSETAPAATGREIILEIVRNMREGLEPLRYTTLTPAIFHVYLHPADLERLRGITSRIIDEARQALDAELASMNRCGLAGKLFGKHEPKVAAPEGGWKIELFENTDQDAEAGDIVIYSELAMPAEPEYGSGSMTKRIATRRLKGELSSGQTFEPAASPPAPAQPVHAVIEYQDNDGPKTYMMTKNQIVVGRGGREYWTDMKLNTLPDVSREHLRIRRDPETGQYYLKDLSRLGTTINGVKVPSAIDYTAGERKDNNVEVPLPPRARIGLAGVVFMNFEASGN